MWTRRAPRRLRSPAGTPSGSKGLGLGPRGHLAARAPTSPAWPLPVSSVGRPGGAGRTLPHPPASLRCGPSPAPRPRSPGRGRAAPPSQDARGSAGAARASRPALALPNAVLQSSASSSGHFAKCSPNARCCVPSGATEQRRQGAGSALPDFGDRGAWPGIVGARGRRLAHSLRAGAAGPPARLLPPPGRPRACWPAALGAVAEAAHRAGWGLSGQLGDSTPLSSCSEGHKAPPPGPRPWPARALRESAGGTRGDAAPRGGSRKGRPAGLAGTSRGHPDPAAVPSA